MAEERQSLGEYFRAEREKRGLDLKEIEERTKISAQTLIFLEEDRLDMLPPRAFLRGFLRVISKEFGFDEEELLARLEEALSRHEKKGRPAGRGGDSRDHTLRSMVMVSAIVAVIVLVAIILSLGYCSGRRTDGGAGPEKGPDTGQVARACDTAV